MSHLNYSLVGLAVWLVIELIILLVMITRGKKISVKTPGGTEISAELRPGKYRVIKNYSSFLVAFLLVQILVFSIFIYFSPIISGAVCEISNVNYEKVIPVRIVADNEQDISMIVIEVNGNSENLPTNSIGETNVELNYQCSDMPGCDCDLTQPIRFVLMRNGEVLQRLEKNVSTEWIEQNENEQLIIKLKREEL